MFKIIFGIIIGAAIVFGYNYINPKTYDVQLVNNSGEIIAEVDLIYNNTLCPNSCTLVVKNLAVGDNKTLFIQNPDTGSYVVKATFSDQTTEQSDQRTMTHGGRQIENITTLAIQKKY